MSTNRHKRLQQNKKNHAAKQQMARTLEKKWSQKVYDMQQWMVDPEQEQLEQQAAKSSLVWQEAIIELASKRQLDRTISLISSSKNQRLVTRDALNQVGGQVGQREGQDSPYVYRVWGMSVTTDLPNLISMQRLGQQLQDLLQQQIGGEVAVVAFIPDHVACAVTPQNLWNITTAFTSQDWNEEHLVQLRDNMQSYALSNHIDVEKLGESGGRGILGTCAVMFVSRHTIDKDVDHGAFEGFGSSSWTQQWSGALDQFKDEHGVECLCGQPEQWSNAVIQAVLRSTECQWSLNSMLEREQYSLLNISRVDIVLEQGDRLFFEAYCGEQMFARANAPLASMLWVVHFLQYQWSQRGILVLNGADQR